MWICIPLTWRNWRSRKERGRESRTESEGREEVISSTFPSPSFLRPLRSEFRWNAVGQRLTFGEETGDECPPPGWFERAEGS